MNTHEPISSLPEQRITELAAGFALGELDPAELQELYHLLRRDDATGHLAARVTWQTLTTAIDLRATMSTRFQDTIRHRVATGRDDAGPESFLGRMAARLGWDRPQLEAVPVPEDTPPAPRRTAWIAISLCVLVGSVLLWVAFGRSQAFARITAVEGVATVEGTGVRPGLALDRRPVIVDAGSRVRLAWPAGHEATIHGPANLVPHANGLSLSSGTGWLRLTDAFALGLPDGRLQTAGAARLAVQITRGHSLIGVSSGELRLGPSGTPHAKRILAGQATTGDGTVFPWVTRARWTSEARDEETDCIRKLACPDGLAAWKLEAGIRFATLEDALIIRGPVPTVGGTDEEPAPPPSAPPTITIRPGRLTLRAPGGAPLRISLSGPPLLARRLVLAAPLGQAAHLRIQGVPQEIPLPFRQPPRELRCVREARLDPLRFHSGPPPQPPADG